MMWLWLSMASAGTWEVVESVRDDAADVTAPMAERATLQAFFTRVTAYAAANSVPPDLDARCLELDLTCTRGDRVLYVHGGVNTGRGLFAVRLGRKTAPLVVAAPHGWFDLNTGRMASDWFDDGYARVLVINTAHRYGGTEGERRDDADVAHSPDTAFQSMVLGASDGLSDPLVVQVHGFSERHGDFSAVVSDGETLQPNTLVSDVADAVAAAVGGDVRRGYEVPLLAATQNAQGRAVSGRGRFVHIELSRDSRYALRGDDVVAKRLGERLADLAESP